MARARDRRKVRPDLTTSSHRSSCRCWHHPDLLARSPSKLFCRPPGTFCCTLATKCPTLVNPCPRIICSITPLRAPPCFLRSRIRTLFPFWVWRRLHDHLHLEPLYCIHAAAQARITDSHHQSTASTYTRSIKSDLHDLAQGSATAEHYHRYNICVQDK